MLRTRAYTGPAAVIETPSLPVQIALAAAVAVGLVAAAAVALAMSGARAERTWPAVAGGVAAAVVAGAIAAVFLSPSHPRSATASPPPSAVRWIWSGAVTDRSARVVAKLAEDGTAPDLLVSRGAGAGAAVGRVAGRPTGAPRTWSFAVAGLRPGMSYRYAIEIAGRADLARAGAFRTLPVGPASFRLAVGADASTGSNGAVFDRIREDDPAVFLNLGDAFYVDIPAGGVGEQRAAFDQVLTSPAQSALYRAGPVAYVWDDHDTGGQDTDAASPSMPAAHRVYRELVPHHPLLAGDRAPIAQAFTIGRARVILTDLRSARRPRRGAPTDTMLGVRQRDWLLGELRRAAGRPGIVIWGNPVPWIVADGEVPDSWGGFPAERRRIARAISGLGLAGRMVMVTADAHMVALDDGTNSGYAGPGSGFPVLSAAALDRRGEAKGGPYSEGIRPGSGYYGLIEVEDRGGPGIAVTLSGRRWDGDVLMRLTRALDARPAQPAGG